LWPDAQWHAYETKAAERASQLAEQRVSAAELLQASEARFAASPPRTSAEAQHQQPAATDVSRILRSGQRIAQAADVLGVKHPRDTRDRSFDAEPAVGMAEGMPTMSPSKTAGRGTTWTVTAQHVSAVLAASKRTMADRPTVGNGTPGRPRSSKEHGSKTDRGSGGSSAQQEVGDARTPPSAESVRSPLLDTRLGNVQRQGPAVSLDGGTATAAQHRPGVRASQPDVSQTGPRTEAATGTRAAGRRPTSDRTLSTRGAAPSAAHGGGSHHAVGMRDAGPPSGAGTGSGYAGQHAAREAAAAAAARAELEAVTAELEAARGQLAEALRATQAERNRAQDKREAAARDIEQERDEHRTRLQVRLTARLLRFVVMSAFFEFCKMLTANLAGTRTLQCLEIAVCKLLYMQWGPQSSIQHGHRLFRRRRGRRQCRPSPRSARSRSPLRRPLTSEAVRWTHRWLCVPSKAHGAADASPAGADPPTGDTVGVL